MVYYSVWVGGLKKVVQERDLTEKFSPYGDVKHVKIFRDKETKKSLCNGFVIYGQKIEAEHAGRMAHRSLIYGGPIIARGPSEQKSRGYSGVYTGKTGYTPRINGDKRPYTDCIHYLNSVCNNESHCPYRHRDYSHTTPLCPLWYNDRGCTDIDCPKRHPGYSRATVNDSQDAMVVPLYTSMLSSDENDDAIRLASDTEYERIKAKFNQDWLKGTSPNIKAVFFINNDHSKVSNFRDYQASLQQPYQQTEEHYHGTKLLCDITHNKNLCHYSGCGICRISDSGFDRNKIKSRSQRFGPGFYLAPNSSKCHNYTKSTYTYRALLLCDVCPGRKYTLKKYDTSLNGPPSGYDSIYGEMERDEEILLSNANAILPKYIIVYT